MHTRNLIATGGILGALAVSACDLDIGDLNNPGIDQLQSNPTALAVNTAATGLLIGNRAGHGAENGYVSQLGILGREAYCFDSADPRFVRELLEGTLNAGSPFGGAFWAAPYANIRLGNIILHALDKTGDLSAADKAGIRGFTRTIQALDLLRVIITHNSNGAVVETDRDVTAELAPIVDKPTTFAAIAKLLDDAVPDFQAGGSSFSFLLNSGFHRSVTDRYDTPPTFLKFNRAIRARVAVYMKDYMTAKKALDDSFIVDAPDNAVNLDAGVYYTFSTLGGDVTNGLISPAIYVHPSVKTDALPIDARVARKVGPAQNPGASRGLSSDQAFTLYTQPTSPIPLIRNEELILLRAEVKFYLNDVLGAVNELNVVRTKSGGLPQISTTGTLPNEATFVDELLYERRYSLLFEGHRWIDVLRFEKQSTLPIEKAPPTNPPDPKFPNGKPHTLNIRYPIPQAECDARPDEPRCAQGST